MRNTLLGIGAATLFVTAAPSFAGSASLVLLDNSIGTDVTIDSLGITHVLTNSILPNGPITLYESFMGSAYFGTHIGDGFGWSMSEDATAVAGKVNLDGQTRAARWTPSGGWVNIGTLGATGGGSCQSSTAYGITADGETIVGLGWENVCSARAFIWTNDTDMVGLDISGTGGNRASVISADGSTAAGFGQSASRSPTVWNTGDLSIKYFDAETYGEFWGMTPDGVTIVGSSDGPAVYWNECEGIVPIGTLGSDTSAQGYDISADGTVIVGASGIVFQEQDRAFVWTRQTGIINLQQLLIDSGVDIPDGVNLDFATGISADGTTVVGRALDPSVKGAFPFRAYVATLPDLGPDPCPADFDRDGQVGFTDLTALLGVWGPCLCPTCPEDLDGDEQVGFTDLTELLGTWGPCL